MGVDESSYWLKHDSFGIEKYSFAILMLMFPP